MAGVSCVCHTFIIQASEFIKCTSTKAAKILRINPKGTFSNPGFNSRSQTQQLPQNVNHIGNNQWHIFWKEKVNIHNINIYEWDNTPPPPHKEHVLHSLSIFLGQTPVIDLLWWPRGPRQTFINYIFEKCLRLETPGVVPAARSRYFPTSTDERLLLYYYCENANSTKLNQVFFGGLFSSVNYTQPVFIIEQMCVGKTLTTALVFMTLKE